MYLSSYTFLQPEDRANLRLSPTADVLYGRLMQWHETAHQWWGDLVMWRSYRDQWISEALANYCALMMVENDSPQQFAAVMDHYRQQLLTNNKEGMPLKDAGPVTLGIRLSSSRFPSAYDEVAYGRGTWLLHMLRHMLRDAAGPGAARLPARNNAAGRDELFWQVLRGLQELRPGETAVGRIDGEQRERTREKGDGVRVLCIDRFETQRPFDRVFNDVSVFPFAVQRTKDSGLNLRPGAPPVHGHSRPGTGPLRNSQV